MRGSETQRERWEEGIKRGRDTVSVRECAGEKENERERERGGELRRLQLKRDIQQNEITDETARKRQIAAELILH